MCFPVNDKKTHWVRACLSAIQLCTELLSLLEGENSSAGSCERCDSCDDASVSGSRGATLFACISLRSLIDLVGQSESTPVGVSGLPCVVKTLSVKDVSLTSGGIIIIVVIDTDGEAKGCADLCAEFAERKSHLNSVAVVGVGPSVLDVSFLLSLVETAALNALEARADGDLTSVDVGDSALFAREVDVDFDGVVSPLSSDILRLCNLSVSDLCVNVEVVSVPSGPDLTGCRFSDVAGVVLNSRDSQRIASVDVILLTIDGSGALSCAGSGCSGCGPAESAATRRAASAREPSFFIVCNILSR